MEIIKLENLSFLDLRNNPLPIPPEILERVNGDIRTKTLTDEGKLVVSDARTALGYIREKLSQISTGNQGVSREEALAPYRRFGKIMAELKKSKLSPYLLMKDYAQGSSATVKRLEAEFRKANIFQLGFPAEKQLQDIIAFAQLAEIEYQLEKILPAMTAQTEFKCATSQIKDICKLTKNVSEYLQLNGVSK